MKYGDGSVYEGQWRDGTQHGSGTMTDKHGRKETGNWQNGVPLNRI